MANADTLFGKASKLVGTMIGLRWNPEVSTYIAGAPENRQVVCDYQGALALLREPNVAEKIVDENDSQVVADAMISAASSVHYYFFGAVALFLSLGVDMGKGCPS